MNKTKKIPSSLCLVFAVERVLSDIDKYYRKYQGRERRKEVQLRCALQLATGRKGNMYQDDHLKKNPEGGNLHFMDRDLIPILAVLELHLYMFSALQVLFYFKIL